MLVPIDADTLRSEAIVPLDWVPAKWWDRQLWRWFQCAACGSCRSDRWAVTTRRECVILCADSRACERRAQRGRRPRCPLFST